MTAPPRHQPGVDSGWHAVTSAYVEGPGGRPVRRPHVVYWVRWLPSGRRLTVARIYDQGPNGQRLGSRWRWQVVHPRAFAGGPPRRIDPADVEDAGTASSADVGKRRAVRSAAVVGEPVRTP